MHEYLAAQTHVISGRNMPISLPSSTATALADVGYRFGQIAIGAPDEDRADVERRYRSTSGVHVDRSVGRPTIMLKPTRQEPDGRDREDDDPDGMLTEQELTLSGGGPYRPPPGQSLDEPPASGECTNGGGESRCNVFAGRYEVTRNDNDCCTRECTAAHEQLHVADQTALGCCRRLSLEWFKNGADRVALKARYEAWLEAAKPIFECRAYRQDVACARRLAAQKGCTGVSQPGGMMAGNEAGTTGIAAAAETVASSEGSDVATTAQTGGRRAARAQEFGLSLDDLRLGGKLRQLSKRDSCCLDIAGYEQTYGAKADRYCVEAPATMPPCPFR